MTEPSLASHHFRCPHCEKVADQAWLNAYVSPINNPAGVPVRIAGEDLEGLARNPQLPPEVREQKLAYWNRVNSGEVFLDRWAPVQTDLLVAGLEISVCLQCRQAAVWLAGKLAYPAPE